MTHPETPAEKRLRYSVARDEAVLAGHCPYDATPLETMKKLRLCTSCENIWHVEQVAFHLACLRLAAASMVSVGDVADNILRIVGRVGRKADK